MIPPSRYSRHRFTTAQQDDAGKMFLSERTPYDYRDLPDTTQHTVKSGDTLFNLAGRYYAAIDRGAGLWWVIADFQPAPVQDPTIALAPGSIVFVPSLRTVLEEILNENRRPVEEG